MLMLLLCLTLVRQPLLVATPVVLPLKCNQ